MRKAFQRSLRVHAGLIAQAVRQDPAAPRTPARLLRLALGMPPYLALQTVHWLGLAADDVLFSAYRQTPIRKPLFILGIPRSGTTFTHRILADSDRYTTLTAWEALIAPSITERRVWQALGRLDAAIGSPGTRLLRRAVATLAGGMDDIHAVALDDAEEDYLALLPAAGCFILALGFPGAHDLWDLARLDRDMADADREALLDFYDGILRRHVYAHGGDACLLSKNAAFASWADALAQRYPDARFLVCVREPIDALSSQLSAIAPARAAFATDPDASLFPKRFAAIFANAYKHLRETVDANSERMAVVDFDALRHAPARTLTAALEAVGITPDAAMRQALVRADAAAQAYRSTHDHDIRQFPLDAHACRAAMKHDYAALLAAAPDTDQREVS